MNFVLFAAWPLLALGGAISLFTSPFSMAYASATTVVYWSLGRILHRQFAATAVGIASVLLWSSLLISEAPISYSIIPELSAPVEKAGFPFTVFQYPFPPMGGDLPPLRMWPLFFSNYAFWLMPGAAISLIVMRNSRPRRNITSSMLALTVLVGLCGLGYTVLKFD